MYVPPEILVVHATAALAIHGSSAPMMMLPALSRMMRWSLRGFWLVSSSSGRSSLTVLVAGLVSDGRVRVAILIEQQYERLRRVALRLARSPDEAGELVQEVALAALSAPVGTVRSRLHRAHARLRRHLGQP
ncbi:hypothetical protein U7230_07840 [Carboxydochorda subterranea]|uniref:Uncharacterized protein n=1 Tax=Carboxydichorda subterranea TaxID=3109565 RepID=A0ABZ1C2C6_9FIRM|nr:hypothetical protein [Limnochorda sp. L945t]WRP18993.1 hypothetical protein U7230_07840 [Limnochorda sp. L945t]